MAITPEEQLCVQNSVSLSFALMSFASALLAGAVAGFLAIADKIKSGWIAAILVLIVLFSIVALTASIFFGGNGIRATNHEINLTTTTPPTPFPANYGRGNFNKQAASGILGLILGGVGFILLAAFAMRPKSPTAGNDLPKQLHDLQRRVSSLEEEMHKDVHQNMHDLQNRVARLEGDTQTLTFQISHLMTAEHNIQGAATSPASSTRRRVHRYQSQTNR
jgi:TolA-binding protein